MRLPRNATGLAIPLLFLILCAFWTKEGPAGWNDISRVAAMESLAQRSSWIIDDSPWIDKTEDKVFLSGHFYSDKMPLLSLFGAGAYKILHSITGASLSPDCAQSGQGCSYRWLTLLLVGLPASITLWLFFRFTSRILELWGSVFSTLALGFGTMLWPYGLVLNHHVPAAACLFASLYALISGLEHPSRRLLLLLASGILAGLAVSFDALAAILVASLCVIALARARKDSIYFAIGLFLPLALTAALDYWIARTIIPPYMLSYGYVYPGSQSPATIAGNGQADDIFQYAFKMLLGAQGLIAYEPILFFALIGILLVVLRKGHPLRLEALCTGAASSALTLYLIFSTGNLGGVAYGERWFIIALPLVLVFLLPGGLLAGPRMRIAAIPVLLFALFLSVASSYQGTLHPWAYSEPPLQLTRSATEGVIGFRWNLEFPLK